MTGYDSSEGTDSIEGAGVDTSLTDLAYSLEISPTPYQDVLRGGRRRRARRRLLAASGVALATAAVIGSTASLHLGGSGTPGTTVASAGQLTAAATTATVSGTTSGTGAVGDAPAVPARDPFKPVTVLLAQGSSGGKVWKAWADLWPAAPKQDALRQLQAMDAVRSRAIPQLPPATRSEADASWRAATDLVNLYVTQDGKRLVDDSVHDSPAPGAVGSTSTTAMGGGSLVATLLGFKGAEMGTTPVLLAQVGGDAAKVVVTWDDGSTSTPAIVTVGDSPVRWFAVARKAGQSDRSIKVYDAHGKVLLTDTQWFH